MTGNYLLVIIDRHFWEERLTAMLCSACLADQLAVLCLAGQPLDPKAARTLPADRIRQRIRDSIAAVPDATLGAIAQTFVLTKEARHECSSCCRPHA